LPCIGRNPKDIGIHPEAQGLPTTQKAVVNAIMQSGVANDIANGYRVVSMDNRYQCPELAVGLRDRCKVLSTGTCRKNRKGWPVEMLNMGKAGVIRGTSTIVYDYANELMCMQWRDNKVVNCCTTLLDTGLATATRREGAKLLSLTVPAPLKHYHKYMGGVDRGDQRRMHLGGFARKAHFKKWYKKAFFAVLDCMLVNAFTAWTLSAKEIRDRASLSRHEFYMYVTHSLLQYGREDDKKKEGFRRTSSQQGEACVLMKKKGRGRRCCVCRLDAGYGRDLDSIYKKVVWCDTCKNHVHDECLPTGKIRKLHDIFSAGKGSNSKQLSCHEILKSEEGKVIWTVGGSKRNGVMTSHSIVQQLKNYYRGRQFLRDEGSTCNGSNSTTTRTESHEDMVTL
jgi:Transposase IS4